jgi:hypothetical protein
MTSILLINNRIVSQHEPIFSTIEVQQGQKDHILFSPRDCRVYKPVHLASTGGLRMKDHKKRTDDLRCGNDDSI